MGSRFSNPVNHFEHRKLRKGVAAYVDGEADTALAVAVRRHLTECWSCSEDAEWLALVKATLVHVGARRAPELTIARLGRFALCLLEQPRSTS